LIAEEPKEETSRKGLARVIKKSAIHIPVEEKPSRPSRPSRPAQRPPKPKPKKTVSAAPEQKFGGSGDQDDDKSAGKGKKA